MKRLANFLAVALLLSGAGRAAERPGLERLGRDEKLRIVVDKVMQRHKGWVAEEWMVRASAEAGFNVYCPRQGADDPHAVARVTAWCRTHGLYHMPWMRGTLRAPADEAEDHRLVWADGTVSRLYSPNADALWAWMTRQIVAYAKLAAKDPTLGGVFLDYENYEPTRKANCYGLSYDLGILRSFAKDRGVTLPDLAPADRKPYLLKRKLHDAFERFQVDHWRQRSRALRQAVDRHAPAFRFCVYPAPGTKLIVEALYREWATKAAPLILADASTYGRPQFLPLKESLDYNRAKLVAAKKIPRKAGIEFIYTGGIDPVVRGADPEFCGKNAVMISEATDGYWIFYEGPTYTKNDHRQYWKWFTWANRAIAAKRWTTQHEPRETPRQWNFRLWKLLAKLRPEALSPAALGPAPAPGSVYSPLRLRAENLLVLPCRRGKPATVELRHRTVARYRNLLAWELRDASRKLLSAGTAKPQTTAKIAFTPDRDGLYLLAVSAGQCAYSLARANVPVGLYAGPEHPLSVIGGANRLYFHVPAGTKQFTVTAQGHGAETVRLDVLDPTGHPAATGQTTLRTDTVAVGVDVGRRGGATWSLALRRADEGVLEDASVALGKRLPAVVFLPFERPAAARRNAGGSPTKKPVH